MSLKDLFKEEKNLKSAEPLTKNDFKDEIESFDYAVAINQSNARFVATEGFDNPSNFARFGLAEKYYKDALTRIHDSYPYDGSLKEKVLWELSSSLIDLHIFENGYPRTTGYANFLVSAATSGFSGDFYPPVSNEYILVKGGPHAGSGNSLYYNQVTDEVVYRKDANVYDLSNDQENNLLIDGTKGNTVEFWLKKDAFVESQDYYEFVLDTHVTGTEVGDSEFGRLVVALATDGVATNTSNQPIYVNYASGSDNIKTYLGSDSLTVSSVADGNWHHYAIRMKTSGSNTVFDLFVDGQHDDSATVATTIGYVSGGIVATLGAQAAPYHDGSDNQGDRGWSPLSGAIDEFRYWKRWRTSKQIQTRWFDQVGGGTNTDLSNTDLGVYFKFNEGITQTSSIDSTVLDYSGRVSNGIWTGYNANYSRETGSAILESSASLIEFNDPIIYSFHPDVVEYRNRMVSSGSIYDDGNVNSLKSYMPAWMLEANSTSKDRIQDDYLLNLLQIIASYFDEAVVLLKKLPELSHAKYYQGKTTPPPFNKKALESSGFMIPEIFVDASLLENFEDRDEQLKFEKSLQEVKNIIYQNIYNNLNYIYKSKGTEKSIRNLLRCFGIGDNVLKINLYANESTYKIEDNLKLTTRRKNYINFNELNTDGTTNDEASVYQYKIDDNSTSFISGTGETDGTFEGAGLSFTLESNIILPNRVSQGEYSTTIKGYENKVANLYPLHVSSSLFGMHTANGTENDLTWATNDYANLQVFTVKDDLFSSNAYFKLTGTLGGFMPELTSSVFNDTYDDELWTVSVTIEPSKLESINQVSGTEDSDYTVRFYGVSHIADYKANEFLVSGIISNDAGRKILSSPKRVFVGAHRTNFTGSVLDQSDVKINSCKAWFSSIPTGTIDNHNLKLGNFGAEKPTQNAFLYQDSINDRFVPEAQTLALLWNFSTVTGSDINGEFSVEDETSGSADDDRYGWFSGLVSRRHTASGSFFINSSTSVVESLERSVYQPQVPEVLTDANLTRILSEDDEYFDRNTRPTTYHLSIEKNLFQDISEEMLNMFGSVVWFNNMIGSPVNVYRGEYKDLKKAADLFFEKVGNDYDFDKYVEYFKFIDYSVSRYLVKLVPASMLAFEDGISTIIENFALGDRNKFRNKLPYIKDVTIEPEANASDSSAMMVTPAAPGFSDNISYTDIDASVPNPNSYKHMQAPISDEQKTNAAYWNQRSERANPVISSGDTEVDANRQTLLDVINNNTNTKPPLLRDNSTSENYEADGNVFVNRRYGRVYSVRGINKQDAHGGGNSYENKKVGFFDSLRKRPTESTPGEGGLISIEPPDSKLESFRDIDDNLELNKGKRKYKFSAAVFVDGTDNPYEVYKGQMIFPFSLYSSSVNSNPAYADISTFQENLAITNLHHDNYGPFGDVPMQGPFTEKYVGGRAYRHVMTNFTIDNEIPDEEGERLEGWKIEESAGALDLLNAGSHVLPHNPKSVFFREEYAKRPVNIKNIRQLTGAAEPADGTDAIGVTKIGNYSEDYEIVLTNGRSINNRMRTAEFAEFGLSRPLEDVSESTFISGVIDFAIPRRDLTGSNKFIIVNRFAAPGDPSTMSEGFLDTAAAELSVYNVLPYRNLSVVLPLQEFYANHTNQFGYYSDQFNIAAYEELDGAGFVYPGGSSSVNLHDYSGTGSFHKVNRNGRQAIRLVVPDTGLDDLEERTVKYNNWHHQHAIPQTDAQYAWITASLVQNYSGSALFDYESKGLNRGDFASSDLVFASASDFGSFRLSFDGGSQYGIEESFYIVTDFAGINSNINEPISPDTNTLGYEEFGSPSSTGGRTASTSRRYFGFDKSIVGVDAFNLQNSDGSAVFGDRATLVNYINTFLVSDAENGIPAIAVPAVLNGILLHRQGLFGGSNWKLYKKDYHPIVRYQKNHNQIGYPQGERSSGGTSLKFISDVRIKNFTEPPITSKYKPLRFSFKEDSQEEITNVLLSLGNVRAHFTDHTAESTLSDEFSARHLDSLLPVGSDKQKIQKLTYDSYGAFKNYLNSKDLKQQTEVVYAETIYPKGLYTYLSGTRKRINFVNNFWRENRLDRSRGKTVDLSDNSLHGTSLTNSMGEVIERIEVLSFVTSSLASSSIWKLDAHSDFGEGQPAVFDGLTTESDGVGELQNCYSLFHYQTASNIKPAVNYNRRIKLLVGDKFDLNPGPSGRVGDSPVSTDIYNTHFDLDSDNRKLLVLKFEGLNDATTNTAIFSAAVGDTLWEAQSSANYKPFYDSYDEYAEEGFRNLKDGTILPEFRISEKINDYLAANVNLNYNNYSPKDFFTAFLSEDGNKNLKIETGLSSLTGGVSFDTTEEFLNRYAFSDFYDYFKLVEEDYEGRATGTSFSGQPEALMATAKIQRRAVGTTHKLSCEAILKFLPYDGFYPSERTLQLGTLFSESIASTTTLTGDDANFRTVVQPFFAPGILFNSIKSGIAVDYPVFNSSKNSTDSVVWGNALDDDFDKRLNFDELIEPQSNVIIDAEVDPDLALNSTASYRFTSTPKHTFAMSNFLAETMNLFIGKELSEQAMIVSRETRAGEKIRIPENGSYSFYLQLINSKNIKTYSEYVTALLAMTRAPFSGSDSTGTAFTGLLSSSLQVNTSSITMYNRAINEEAFDVFLYGSSFGPPVSTGEYAILDSVDDATQLAFGFGGSVKYSPSGITGSAFSPFTPPYYDGYSHVLLNVTLNPADYEGGLITREELLTSASYSYARLNTQLHPVATGSTGASPLTTANYTNSMQISSSLFMGDDDVNKILYERVGSTDASQDGSLAFNIAPSSVETKQIIAFRPRWECPVLDFTNATPTRSYVSGNVAKGMWHQYGEIPAAGDGIFMKLEDGSLLSPNSLLSLLNIDPSQTSKVGKINGGVSEGSSDSIFNLSAKFPTGASKAKLSNKEFSEAIIAIPFKFDKSLNETILYPIDKEQTNLIKKTIYKDPSQRFDAQTLNNIRSFEELRKGLSPTNIDRNPLLDSSEDLYNLMLLMRKYVIPPHLDFMHNDKVDPFAMFMIEYSINLKQEDLQNIWQNVEPTFARRALKVTSESNVHLMPTSNQMFDEDNLYFKNTLFDPDVTRWAVFKVKKRAAANYNSIVGKIIHNNHEYIRKDLKGRTDDFLYSYNWPYDFFSLIELAKINSITTFNPIYSKEKDE